ncbi:MAG TPA: hypothetical protein PLB32_20465, partial [Acidobacteriota bacterium]|nr:hypothetical protein [Acidobacteriota bacterium]
MPRFVFAKSLVVLVILVSGISTVTPLAGVNAQNKPEPASQPPADVKKLFDTINQLRVAPDQMPEAITKMVSEQDPGYETSDIFTKDVINGKTRLQNVEDLKTMVSEAEKLSALEWDADLVTLASQFKGEPQNKLFKLEVFRQGNGKPAERAMMWWAADRDFDVGFGTAESFQTNSAKGARVNSSAWAGRGCRAKRPGCRCRTSLPSR